MSMCSSSICLLNGCLKDMFEIDLGSSVQFVFGELGQSLVTPRSPRLQWEHSSCKYSLKRIMTVSMKMELRTSCCRCCCRPYRELVKRYFLSHGGVYDVSGLGALHWSGPKPVLLHTHRCDVLTISLTIVRNP